MKVVWVTVEDYRPAQPEAVDTKSSPTTVYLNKNVKRATKTDPMSGSTVEYWQCERATLTIKEYEEYADTLQLFTTPEYEALKKQVEEQAMALAEVAVNTEYSVCLQEMTMM